MLSAFYGDGPPAVRERQEAARRVAEIRREQMTSPLKMPTWEQLLHQQEMETRKRSMDIRSTVAIVTLTLVIVVCLLPTAR